jgi:hypothetical protein
MHTKKSTYLLKRARRQRGEDLHSVINMNAIGLHKQGQTSNSVDFYIYVIVTIPDDGRYKRPKYVVEDK